MRSMLLRVSWIILLRTIWLFHIGIATNHKCSGGPVGILFGEDNLFLLLSLLTCNSVCTASCKKSVLLVRIQEKFIGAQHSVWTHVALLYTSHIRDHQSRLRKQESINLSCMRPTLKQPPPPHLLFFCGVLKKLFAFVTILLPSKARGQRPRNVTSNQH